MKKTINLLLILVTITTLSCKDDPKDPCIDNICPCDDTIYYTHYEYVDTFVMYDAEYIHTELLSIDSLPTISVDSFQYGDFNIMPAIYYPYSFLLDKEDSVSFLYRGGVRGIYEVFYPPIFMESYDCDPTNSVFIAEDTVTYYIEQPIPYAILEIMDKTGVYIDTAYYPTDFSYSHQTTNSAEELLSVLAQTLVNNGLLTDKESFSDYLKGLYNIGNTGYYLMDVFPPERPYESGGDGYGIEITLFNSNN